MTKQTLPLGRRIYKIALTTSIILSGIFLIVGCIEIFFTGNGYTRDIVASTFSKIDIPIYLCLALIVVDIIWEFISPTEKSSGKKKKKLDASPVQTNTGKNYNIIKFIVLCVAVAAIILGFLFDGYADVLTKAINICTECIGLG